MSATAFRPDRPTTSVLAIARPFLLLAVLAFFAGFGGYLILGPANVMGAQDPKPEAATSASAASMVSAPADDWNIPKKI